MSKYLSKAKIMSATDRKMREVEVPEWGGAVLLAEVPAETAEAWEKKYISPGKGLRPDAPPTAQAELVAACLVDENGERLFKTGQEVTEFARTRSSIVIGRLCEVCMDLNGLSKRARDDLEKNLSVTPTMPSG